MELVLPKDANVTLDLETSYTENFHKKATIKSDLPLEITESPDWDDSHGTPRKYVRVKQSIRKGWSDHPHPNGERRHQDQAGTLMAIAPAVRR